MRDDAFLLAMIHALPDPVLGVDGEGRIRAWNAAAAVTFGYAEEDAYGAAAAELLGVVRDAPAGAVQHLRGRAGAVDASVDVVPLAGADSAHGLQAMLVVRLPSEAGDGDVRDDDGGGAAPGAAGPAAGGDGEAGLSPRLRQTLEGLCEGLAEKEIAARLGLSPHTVHDYVKAVYRHFRVQSRAALVARVLVQRTAAPAPGIKR